MMLALWASWEKVFFTTQIISLTLNFSTIWLVGCWLTLVTQCWNRNRVYSSITLMLATLRWSQHHIVNQALFSSGWCLYNNWINCKTIYTISHYNLWVLLSLAIAYEYFHYKSSFSESRIRTGLRIHCTSSSDPYPLGNTCHEKKTTVLLIYL